MSMHKCIHTVRKKSERLCPEGKFTCGDKTCISIIGRCDRKIDCPHDSTDEEGCRMFIAFTLICLRENIE